MGYGHQRAVHPFRDVARERIISMNTDGLTPKREQGYWKRILKVYEFVSRSREFPVIGKMLFGLMNRLLEIPPRDSRASLSKPNFQVKMLQALVRRGLCRGVIDHIKENPAPVITSFYAPAIAADVAGLREVYCIICDSDLNRVWVSADAAKSNISYFVPCQQAADRLRQYGVAQNRIYHTGFPLHPSLVGADQEISKQHLDKRIRKFEKLRRSGNLSHGLTEAPLSITFAVGGAGAQAQFAGNILTGFCDLITSKAMRINLVAGTRPEVKDYFEKLAADFDAQSVQILFSDTRDGYFTLFNRIIPETDILFTKPSELSFFAGLGLPLIMMPPLGSQEAFNRQWLLDMQAGMDFPENADPQSWLLRMLKSGMFIKMARHGYENIRKDGYYRIINLLGS